MVSYARTILDVAHVGQSLGAYLIGEGNEANFTVRGTDLPNPSASPLVSCEAVGYVLTFTPAMRGSVEFGGESLSLIELVASGRARAIDGAHRFVLPTGAKARVVHGEVRFDIRIVERSSIVTSRAELDRPFWSSFAGTAMLGTAFYLLMRAMPDDAMAMQQTDQEAKLRFASYFHQADEPIAVQSVSDTAMPTSEQARPERSSERASQRSARSRGEKPGSSERSGRVGPRRAGTELGRSFDLDADARNRGILALLPSQDGFLAHAGTYALGTDDANVWESVTGIGSIGSSTPGGLDVHGTPRVGGVAGNVVGIAEPGLAGIGDGSSSNYRGRPDHGFGERRQKVPNPRIEKSDVSGPLDKDMIRQIVRRHFNEVRHCYNEGLTRNPKLAGRVTVRFTVAGTGTVATAVVQENGTNDGKVATCIAQAIKRWKFPSARTGATTIVTYPFMLTTI